jgi:hypothetical protein
VNATTSPTPATLVGVMATGWWGQNGAGGATIMRQRGQREAAILSITVPGAACSDQTEGGLL